MGLFNFKMVVTGDITQIDLPREHESGLVVVADILEKVEGIEFVRFGSAMLSIAHPTVRSGCSGRVPATPGAGSSRRHSA